MRESPRNPVIDCLRGLAATAVALLHFNAADSLRSDSYHHAVAFGWLGVPVFFVVSGYCIAHARQHDSPVRFFGRRLLRIYPPLWASMLLVLLVALIRKATFGVNDFTVLPSTAREIGYTVAGLTAPASEVHSVNWVYWSLSFELAFYLVVGLVVLRWFNLGIICFSLIALVLRDWGYPFSDWNLFALGISAYLMSTKELGASAVLLLISSIQGYLIQPPYELVTALCVFALIVFPPAIFSQGVFRSLRRLGDRSYSLYLLHVPIGCYVGSVTLSRLFSRALIPSIARDLLLLAFCIGAAHLFHRWIEHPAHQLGRRWFKRDNGPPADRKSTMSVLQSA